MRQVKSRCGLALTAYLALRYGLSKRSPPLG